MNQQASIRHLKIAIALVLSVLALGIVGYMLIEHFSFIDALFTTVDMMSTVGITAQPLSDHGRLFTIVIIILREAGIQYAQALLVATDQDANNIYITLSARNLNPNLHIVSRANHDETIVKLKRAGADRVLSPYTIGGHRMANLALQPTVVDFFDTLINAENPDLAVQEVILPAHSPFIGKTIVDAQNMLTDGTMILAIKKPSGLVMGSRLETRIESGDAAMIVGTPEQLAAFARKNR